MQLANLASRPLSPRSLPPEPILPAFHKLSRLDLRMIADKFLTVQEEAVFKAFVNMVANRAATDVEMVGALRGSLAREIKGLQLLREEFEGPISSDDEPAPVDEDVPAGGPPSGESRG